MNEPQPTDAPLPPHVLTDTPLPPHALAEVGDAPLAISPKFADQPDDEVVVAPQPTLWLWSGVVLTVLVLASIPLDYPLLTVLLALAGAVTSFSIAVKNRAKAEPQIALGLNFICCVLYSIPIIGGPFVLLAMGALF